MKKIIISIIICVLFLQTQSFCTRYSLANQDKDGLYAKSIEQVLRLEPEDIDIGTAALIVAEQWSDVVHGRRYLFKIDDMATELLKRLEDKELGNNYKAVQVINEYLFDELGYTSVKEATDPNDLFLHSVMDRKKGYCLSLSILYLALAERIGLPLYGVVVPGHFFVRYDDGRNLRFNIEATSGGGFADDEHYMKKFNVPEDSGDGVYMTNLNSLQTLGCLFNNLGNEYLEIDDIEMAQLALERAVQINPTLAESHTNLGNIYLKQDRTKKAIHEYQKALEIKPDDAKTYSNLGNAYSNDNRLSAALTAYTRSIQLDGKSVDTYINMSLTYRKLEMYTRAMAVLRDAMKIDSDNSKIHEHLGTIYTETGDDDKAIVEYKRALSLQPNMLTALVNLGNIFFKQKDYDTAIEQYQKAIELTPDDSRLYYNLAASYFNKDEPEIAAALYKKAVELAPDFADAYTGLAMTHYNLKNYEQARRYLKLAEQKGAKIDPDFKKALKQTRP